MSLPDHLIPVNAALAILDPDEQDYPTPLADVGFELAGIEVPLLTDEGDIVADVVAVNEDRSRLLLIECKNGRNPKTKQITSYQAVEWEEVIRAAAIDVPERPAEAHVGLVFVVTADHAHEFFEKLEHKALSEIPVISVGHDNVTHEGDGDLAGVGLAEVKWPQAVELPCPVRLPFDHQCDLSDAFDAVAAEMVGHLTRAREFKPEAYTIDPTDVLRAVAPAYDHLVDDVARKGTKRIVYEAIDAVIHVASSIFDRSVDDSGPTIAVLSTPEVHKLQGRTQSYQAVLKELNLEAEELARQDEAGRTLFEEAEGEQ